MRHTANKKGGIAPSYITNNHTNYYNNLISITMANIRNFNLKNNTFTPIHYESLAVAFNAVSKYCNNTTILDVQIQLKTETSTQIQVVVDSGILLDIEAYRYKGNSAMKQGEIIYYANKDNITHSFGSYEDAFDFLNNER